MERIPTRFSYKYIKKNDFIEIKKSRIYKNERNDKKNKDNGRQYNNLRRARRAINEILTLNLKPQHLLITLTYMENMQDYDKAKIYFRRFIRRLGNPQYLDVRELQKRGAIHHHTVLFTKDLTEDDIIKAWGLGRIDFQVINNYDIDRIANYLGKYLSDKEKGQELAKNKRMYNTSRGLKRYKVETIEPKLYYKLKEKSKIKIETINYIKHILSRE